MTQPTLPQQPTSVQFTHYPPIPQQYTPFTPQPTWRERMSGAVTVLAFVLVLALGGVGVLGVKLHQTQDHLSASRSQVKALVVERDGLADDLAGAQSDLKSTKDQLSSAQSSLSDARQQVSGLKSTATDERDCLLSWLNAFSARNRDDLDTTLATIDEGKATCDRGADEMRQYVPEAMGGSSSGI